MKLRLGIALAAALLVLTACAVPVVTPATNAPGAAATAAATEAATEAAAVAGKHWEPADCAAFGVAPELAPSVECGYVTAPENRSAGTDAKIQLAVVRVPSTSATPGAPMMIGTGAPGGNGLQAATTPAGGATLLTTFAPILADRDLILFSQRGTANARPALACPDYELIPLQSAINGWSVDEKMAHAKAAFQACLDGYKAQGIDLTGYNSVENAEDIDDIRQALGYDKIFYYGQSYGTLLGQYLLRAHPEILDGIILDGIAPATATRWTDVTKIADSFGRVWAACAADATCHARYPDPEGALAKALQAMKENPPIYPLSDGKGETVDLKVDDTLAMNALFINMYIGGGYSALPDIVYKLSQGDYSPLSSTIPLFFSASDVLRGQHFSIACSDDPIASLDEVNLDVPDMYKGLILDDARSYAMACPLIALPHLPDSSDELVKSDLPALLIQGGLDPATPVEGGNKVQEGLPNSYNVIVPAGSHIQLHSPCILNMIAAFMHDPQAAPDTSCVDPNLFFTVTFDRPTAVSVASPSASAAMTMVLPSGFQTYLGPGKWYNGQALINALAYDAGKSVDDVVQEAVSLLPVKVEATDGPVIAGLPSTMIQVDAESQGQLLGANIYIFGDEKGAYKLSITLANPATFDQIRQDVLPGMLESITVGQP